MLLLRFFRVGVPDCDRCRILFTTDAGIDVLRCLSRQLIECHGDFVGTLVLADFFIESRMPAVLAEKSSALAPNTCRAMLLLSLLTGLISAFVENVAMVLIMAPIALALARTLKLNPTTLLIALAVSSNLQGAATLIGDPPSMLRPAPRGWASWISSFTGGDREYFSRCRSALWPL